MSVRRFVGDNSREAMREVRAALGDDALILSNRRTDEGVEVLALADADHGRMTSSANAEESTISASEPVRATVQDDAAPASSIPSAAQPSVVESDFPGHHDFAALSRQLLGEMQDMRAMLSRQGTDNAADVSSVVSRLRHRLVSAGFSVALSDDVLAMLPDEIAQLPVDDPGLDDWLIRQLMSSLRTPDSDIPLLDSGGIVALVGPTGVGKTTTTAKLASRYVMQHGSEHVALVTTDGYRVGAHEQLRIYADLLGIEVYALDSEADLSSQLTRLADKALIIIDTVGMSQRDQRLVRQIADLARLRSVNDDRVIPVHLMLLLNAASQGDTLEDVVTTYKQAVSGAGGSLHHCILTKHDEAARLGPVLDSIMRHGLTLHYVSYGQQVPEDLALADGRALIEQALSAAGDSPYSPDAEQMSVQGAQLQRLSRGLLGQGRALTAAFDSLRREITGFSLVEAAWTLCGLARQQQADAWQSLERKVLPMAREAGESSAGMTLLWGPVQHAGSAWPMPVQMLDGAGNPLPLCWQRHRLPASDEQRLDWASHALGVSEHVFARCPGVAIMEWLAAWQLPWIAAAQHNSKVLRDSERVAMASLVALASPVTTLTLRHRGRRIVMQLSALEVASGTLDDARAQDGVGLTAWFGELTDADSGRRMGRRYWLASPDSELGSALIARQMIHGELPALTRQAWQGIDDAGMGGADVSLRLSLASGLASIAVRLEQDDSPWAMDVRARLLSLLGGQRQRRAKRLLEALLQAFVAYDALRELGGPRADAFSARASDARQVGEASQR
ncbi:flagellar biosynthesis protein FlhF [Aidingimonas lacisalsi]|uniref:flagellar biosynthesis protein FlhF n=1 Tax=Aidingimonas lacisalsi TaxID=2604086 RepID=UPI0011D24AFC|nr:flagellar biosynthesis protein FlhF [Aidingimonas lacisalsi]